MPKPLRAGRLRPVGWGPGDPERLKPSRSQNYAIAGAHLCVYPEAKADTWVRPYRKIAD